MKKLLVLVAILVILVGIFNIWWNNGLQAPSRSDTSEKIFVIQKGEAIRQVGNNLKTAGLIKDPVVFFLYVKKENIDRAIQAGSYKLSSSMTLPQLIDTLLHGTIDTWVTIPEGFRSEEIADVLSESVSTYDESWVEALKKHEGYLFPDTYLVPNDAAVEQVISIFRNNFDSKVSSIGIDPTDPDLERVVIVASLIEREALRDDEKPLVASVIYNRLDNDMALDIDATLQYIKGRDAQGNWWSVPNANDRRLDSVYNTYRYPGLPPTPIANPGIVALQAALSPETSTYYFYIHDSEGNVHFSETLEEHNEKVDRYLR